MPPLCVDLDGTLVRTDMLYESFISVVTAMPWLLLLVPFWLLRGKAALKMALAVRFRFDPALLPYDTRVLDYLRAEKQRGRILVLATAAAEPLARAVADHLRLFDRVLASNEHRNLSGARKAAVLREEFGAFAYIGNSRRDLAVWTAAERIGVVNASAGLESAVVAKHTVELRLPRPGGSIRGLVLALRPHQWSKNLLVFVPILTVNQLLNGSAWVSAALAFLAFCVTASGIYVINDLTDLGGDRSHPRKRSRAFACGAVPLSPAVLLCGPALLIGGVGLAAAAGIPQTLCLYAVSSISYSFWLKRLPLVDVFVLAFLYVVRLMAGGLATGFVLSFWLLGFSAFLFFGLAVVKRVAELSDSAQADGAARRRGYLASDRLILMVMGVGSTFAATVLLTLYVQSNEVASRYAAPEVLWLLVPLVLFWQLRLWLSTSRGYMHDDPIVYSVRDWVSWLVSGAAVVIMIAANHGGLAGVIPVR